MRPLRTKAPLVVAGAAAGIVLDVAARTVRGTITKNGKPPTKNAAKCPHGLGVALVTFYELTDLSNVYTASVLCDGDDFSWSVDVPEGTYRVRVTGTSWSDLVGATVLRSFAVMADVDDLVLDEVTYRVAGIVRVSGALPYRDPAVSCTPGGLLLSIYFQDRLSGIIASTDVPCTATDFSFATDLPHGVYDITVEPTGGTAVFGVNVLDWGFTALSLIAVP